MLQYRHCRVANEWARLDADLLCHKSLQSCESEQVPVCALDVVMRAVHGGQMDLLVFELEAQVAEAWAAHAKSAILVVIIRGEVEAEPQTDFVSGALAVRV